MTETEAGARRSDRTRAAILTAARERFAADGYERATIRAIAADAAIDPAMVMRYFGNKEKLFAAAAEFDLRLPDLSGLPTDEVGAALTNHFLDRWEDDESLKALLRASVTNEIAAERMRELFAAQLGPVIAKLADPASAPTRASSRPRHSVSPCAATSSPYLRSQPSPAKKPSPGSAQPSPATSPARSSRARLSPREGKLPLVASAGAAEAVAAGNITLPAAAPPAARNALRDHPCVLPGG